MKSTSRPGSAVKKPATGTWVKSGDASGKITKTIATKRGSGALVAHSKLATKAAAKPKRGAGRPVTKAVHVLNDRAAITVTKAHARAPSWMLDPSPSDQRSIPGIIKPASLNDALAAAKSIGLITPSGRLGRKYR